jgi:hypothetical protein
MLFSSVGALAMAAPLAAQTNAAGQEDSMRQAQELMDATKQIGPWDSQFRIIEEATDNVFAQQAWNSEPDQFVRQLMRDVGRIPPWQPMERNEAALIGLQQRWNLTHDQKNELGRDLNREMMAFTFRHIKDAMPVVMEAVQTRVANEPFTAEQIQQWTQRLRPIMDDGMTTLQRVSRRLEKSMTPQQRELLMIDLDAFERRQRDMKKMMAAWEEGRWNPSEWGLQDDPIHAAAMVEYRTQQAVKDELVRRARPLLPSFDERNVATQESEWERYVKWFCQRYECDDPQRTQANSILQSSRVDAVRYRSSKEDDIAKLEAAIARNESPAKLNQYQDDLNRLLEPITEIFDRLKKRLYEQVLTSAQRSIDADWAKAGPTKQPDKK